MKKAEKLINEALLNLKVGSYNKCVSAAYFGLRMIAENLLSRRKLLVPRRDDKLANVIENLGLVELASSLRILYDLRKKADYSKHDVDSFEAKEALSKAVQLFEETKSLLQNSYGVFKR